jgi:hypothetical protein
MIVRSSEGGSMFMKFSDNVIMCIFTSISQYSASLHFQPTKGVRDLHPKEEAYEPYFRKARK